MISSMHSKFHPTRILGAIFSETVNSHRSITKILKQFKKKNLLSYEKKHSATAHTKENTCLQSVYYLPRANFLMALKTILS